MKNERLKELREWGTFVLTALTVLAIPVGALVLRDQRLQIENSANERFVRKEAFTDFQSATNRKLDAINATMSQVQQDLAKINGKLEQKRNN